MTEQNDVTYQPPSIAALESHAFRLVALRLCLDAVAAEREKGIRGRIINDCEWDAIQWLANVSIGESLRWAEYPVDSDDDQTNQEDAR